MKKDTDMKKDIRKYFDRGKKFKEKETVDNHTKSNRQISFFGKRERPIHEWFDAFSTKAKYNIELTSSKLTDVTFLGKQEQPIHNWFKFTPAFSPLLVEALLKKFNTTAESVILDPFAGSGTTLLVAKSKQHKAYGIEINPFLVFKMKVELNWTVDVKTYKNHIEAAIRFTKQFMADQPRIETLNASFSLQKVNIRNSDRWWNPSIQQTLLLLKYYGYTHIDENAVRDLFLYTIACILLDVANITYGRLQLAFTKPKDFSPTDVYKSISKKAKIISKDLEIVKKRNSKAVVDVIHGNSTKPESYPEENIDGVITSPPYPNRYSYVWNTRPYLFFLDLIDSPSRTSEIDMETIGGTWGRATFELKDITLEPHPEIASIIGSKVATIREDKQNLLMSNYVVKYFNLIYKHLKAMKAYLADTAQLAYVIGNSAISKVYIPADEFLFDIFEVLDYQPKKINRFRARHSRQGLYEAIVFATT